MASSGDAKDNPVAINVVPMVDVIFCLCVFFMCSMKFKQVEGKFDAWLPKDQGPGASVHEPAEIRIAMFWDANRDAVRIQFGSRLVAGDDELRALVRGAHEDFAQKKNPDAPAVLDADARVPWGEVVHVVNTCRELGVENVQFALGKPD